MLTAKQEKFCVNLVSGMSQYEAYVDAYDTDTTRRETVDVNANLLMKDKKIASRIEVLREKVADKVIITAESLVNELEIVKAMTLTEQQKDYNNHIKAIQTQAKLLGLDVVKMDLSSKDGSMRPNIVINTQLKKQGE
jgi:phage terminase small subunit